MAVPPEPRLVASDELSIAYRASPDPGGEKGWVVVHFPGYLHIRYGYPNDEALGAHPLTKYGLGFYGVFEVDHSPLVEEIEKRNAIHPRHIKGMFLNHRHWIFTFQDETLDVISKDGPTFEVVSASSAADALEKKKRA